MEIKYMEMICKEHNFLDTRDWIGRTETFEYMCIDLF